MTITYVIKETDTVLVSLFAEKDESKPNDSLLPSGDVVIVDENNQENDQDWLFVSREADASTKGFIPVRFLRPLDAAKKVKFPVVEESFVRSCARAELASFSADVDDNSPPVLADYLLAWAYIESSTKDALFTNLPADLDGSDAEGPFRLSAADWQDYRNAAEASGVEISDFERFIPNCQSSGAAFVALRDAKAFGRLVHPGGAPSDGPFIPSYLNVFHCHLLGTKAAHHLQELKNKELGSKSVTEVLSDVASEPERKALVANRKSYLEKDGEPATIDIFFELTSQALADGFKKARTVVQKHAADILMPETNDFEDEPPWFTIAKREMKIWQDEELKEGSGPGLERVIDYFKTVKYDTNKNEPWCGAFVGYCLFASNPSFKSTIVKGGARAANWMNWGNMNMRQFDLREIPLGALVVTHPLAAGASGHVGFAAGKVPGTEKIVMLGGNQSNSVTLKHIHKNKIRHIRWHKEISKPKSTSIGPGTDSNFKNLLSLIARKESGGNYNAYFGKAKNQNNPKFTTMTLKEVRDWQDKFVRNGSKSSAVGKYQIIRSTLDGLIASLGVKKSELFDEDLQDRMALKLIEEKRLKDFLNKEISVATFGSLLARVWAALPVLKAETNNKGRKVKRGQSYYAGDGLNKAHIMPEEVEGVLEELLELHHS